MQGQIVDFALSITVCLLYEMQITFTFKETFRQPTAQTNTNSKPHICQIINRDILWSALRLKTGIPCSPLCPLADEEASISQPLRKVSHFHALPDHYSPIGEDLQMIQIFMTMRCTFNLWSLLFSRSPLVMPEQHSHFTNFVHGTWKKICRFREGMASSFFLFFQEHILWETILSHEPVFEFKTQMMGLRPSKWPHRCYASWCLIVHPLTDSLVCLVLCESEPPGFS